jgi:GR25 family glycosyltransferase involved in LPS biosynthesis
LRCIYVLRVLEVTVLIRSSKTDFVGEGAITAGWKGTQKVSVSFVEHFGCVVIATLHAIIILTGYVHETVKNAVTIYRHNFINQIVPPLGCAKSPLIYFFPVFINFVFTFTNITL